MHWNSNSIDKKTQTIEEFELFIKQNNIHIISINETKLTETDQITINNYNIIRKDRSSNGGGVAIIIHEQIEYEQLETFEEFNLELIAIKVILNNQNFTFITFYLPPQEQLPSIKFFQTLSALPNLILCGDLNCKSKQWYSKSRNANGILLEQFIQQHNLTIVKNKKPTHYWSQTNKLDILDLIITSPDINNKIINIKVPQNKLHSDHFPIIFEINNTKIAPAKNKTITTINQELQNKIIEDKISCYYEKVYGTKEFSLNFLITLFEKIVTYAKKQATTTRTKKVDNINIPRHIIALINIKKYQKKITHQFPSKNNKRKLNEINDIIQNEIKAFKQTKLELACEKLAEIKASESKFWAQLKKLENNNKQPHRNIPYLMHKNRKIFNDTDKAELFADKLAAIFKPYQDDMFDDKHRQKIEEFVNSNQIFNYNSEKKYEEKFSLHELEQVLKSIKAKAACPNIAPNSILKKLDIKGKRFILDIINHSFTNIIIPEEWKQAKVTMIPKKPNDAHNPENYRPISLTNSISKLVEKLIKNRLVHYLETNNLIIKNQSGFRSNKCTIDNVIYFKQKCLEAFSLKRQTNVNKMCGIVFDIEKAFDKVWHEGLLYKMHQIKIPQTIAKWIMAFLSKRSFIVKVNGKDSKASRIYTGVPQGAILSPILFLIFINDIPTTVNNYEHASKALLFADDLFKFYWDHNLNRIQVILQRYLNELEEWLSKWRLKTAAHKCSYNIYTEHGINNDEIQLEIFGNKINKENNTRYLGINLDQNLSFIYHVNQMKDKCMRKLNFLKVLRSKKWNAKLETKFQVYSSLIRSITDYAAPLFENISENTKHKIESIQYHSMLHILKLPETTSATYMREMLRTETLEKRHKTLKEKYILNALKNNQLIIDLYKEHKEFCKNHNITDKKYSMFN